MIIRSRLMSSAAGVAAVAAILGAHPVMAQSPQTPPREIGTVTVTDTAIDEAEAEKSYKVSRSTSAMRSDTPLVDVPQSITAVTVRQIEDQAANSIGDAIRYTPGVFSSQGENNRETLTFRGISTTSSFFVDGIRDDVQTYRDLYNIERLEVLRGPSALAFGRGTLGGLINRVTKVADGAQHVNARFEAGSFDLFRGQADIGAPVSDMLSLRVTGVFQDSNSYRDGDYFRRWGFNPTGTASLGGGSTTITLGYEHFVDERVGDRGISSYQNRPLDVPRSRFFGDPQGSPTFTNTDAGTLRVEHRFSDAVTLRNHTRYADYEKFYQNVFPGAVNTAAQTNPAGLPPGVYAPGTIVAISAYNNAQRRRNLFNQTDLNATFATGAIEHTLLVGGEFGRQTTDNRRLEGFFPTATNAQGVQTIFARVDSPQIRRPDLLFRQIASSGDNYSVAKVTAGYVQDQIALSPMFDVVLGVRYEHFNTKVTDRRTVGFPATQQRVFDVSDDLWSPRGGLIFKPTEQASVYLSYSQSFLPRGGDQLAGLSITNQSLDPEKYTNYELGAKWDVIPTFSLAAALFRLDRTNVLVLSDPNNAASTTVPVGTQRTDGVELSAQGEITEQLSVVAAYTYSDATFLNTVSGTVRAGARVPNVPRNAVSVWTRFDPIEPLGLAVGVIHNGRRFAATDNTLALPAYTRFDGAFYYRLNERLDLQLNVENIFNKRYIVYSDNNTNLTPGSPTAFRVGLNVRY